MNNLVAKHAHKCNKAATHRDRKKDECRGKRQDKQKLRKQYYGSKA
jgi:hypothetical protein